MSEETTELIENGSIEEIELLMFDIRDAINNRESGQQEIIDMINYNMEEVNGEARICGRKRPS